MKPRATSSLNSIYDLKLPIPGPPGREPVSRSAVAVVNVETADDDTSQGPARAANPSSPVILDQPDAAFVAPESADDGKVVGHVGQPLSGQMAPFDRPFAERASAGSERAARGVESDAEGAEPFARPFVTASRAALESDSTVNELGAAAADELRDSQFGAEKPAQTSSRDLRPASRTRPAPKPSPRGAALREPNRDSELEYEAFEDDSPYIDSDDL